MKNLIEKILEKLKSPKVWIPCVAGIAILVAVGIGLGVFLDYKETERLDSESVSFVPNLTVEYDEVKKISDFLEKLDGELVNDYEFCFSELGTQELDFEYINIKNKKRPAKLKLEVVDRTAPRIYGGSVYTIYTGYQGDLTDLMMSGDGLDDAPKREIKGDYNLNKVGSYDLEYIVTDASKNAATQKFTLNVIEPSNTVTPPYETESLPIKEVIADYKTKDTKIGIDVSQWQGEIDWEMVKKSGVEFAFVRVGYQYGYDGEYILDPYFEANIKGAEKAGLPVGVYFYSYANSIDEAKRQAEWIIEQIKGYKVELGVAFDWEDWANFNSAKVSFRTLNKLAKTFLDTVKSYGYRGWLYGSKVYLDRIWEVPEYETWLAQYYYTATYTGEYGIWQMSSSGQVPGIDGDVDLNIMYLETQNKE